MKNYQGQEGSKDNVVSIRDQWEIRTTVGTLRALTTQYGLSDRSIILYQYLTSFADCHPSHEYIQSEIGFSRAKIKRCLRELEQAGLLISSTSSGRGKTSTYRVIPPAEKGVKNEPLSIKKRVQENQKKGPNLNEKGFKSEPQHNRSKEVIEKHAEKKCGNDKRMPACNVHYDNLGSFIEEMRKQHGDTVIDNAISRLKQKQESGWVIDNDIGFLIKCAIPDAIAALSAPDHTADKLIHRCASLRREAQRLLLHHPREHVISEMFYFYSAEELEQIKPHIPELFAEDVDVRRVA